VQCVALQMSNTAQTMSDKGVRCYCIPGMEQLDQVPELATKRKKVCKGYIYALVEGCAGKDTETPAEATI
jgi:hypothetical protein